MTIKAIDEFNTATFAQGWSNFKERMRVLDWAPQTHYKVGDQNLPLSQADTATKIGLVEGFEALRLFLCLSVSIGLLSMATGSFWIGLGPAIAIGIFIPNLLRAFHQEMLRPFTRFLYAKFLKWCGYVDADINIRTHPELEQLNFGKQAELAVKLFLETVCGIEQAWPTALKRQIAAKVGRYAALVCGILTGILSYLLMGTMLPIAAVIPITLLVSVAGLSSNITSLPTNINRTAVLTKASRDAQVANVNTVNPKLNRFSYWAGFVLDLLLFNVLFGLYSLITGATHIFPRTLSGWGKLLNICNAAATFFMLMGVFFEDLLPLPFLMSVHSSLWLLIPLISTFSMLALALSFATYHMGHNTWLHQHEGLKNTFSWTEFGVTTLGMIPLIAGLVCFSAGIKTGLWMMIGGFALTTSALIHYEWQHSKDQNKIRPLRAMVVYPAMAIIVGFTIFYTHAIYGLFALIGFTHGPLALLVIGAALSTVGLSTLLGNGMMYLIAILESTVQRQAIRKTPTQAYSQNAVTQVKKLIKNTFHSEPRNSRAMLNNKEASFIALSALIVLVINAIGNGVLQANGANVLVQVMTSLGLSTGSPLIFVLVAGSIGFTASFLICKFNWNPNARRFDAMLNSLEQSLLQSLAASEENTSVYETESIDQLVKATETSPEAHAHALNALTTAGGYDPHAMATSSGALFDSIAWLLDSSRLGAAWQTFQQDMFGFSKFSKSQEKLGEDSALFEWEAIADKNKTLIYTLEVLLRLSTAAMVVGLIISLAGPAALIHPIFGGLMWCAVVAGGMILPQLVSALWNESIHPILLVLYRFVLHSLGIAPKKAVETGSTESEEQKQGEEDQEDPQTLRFNAMVHPLFSSLTLSQQLACHALIVRELLTGRKSEMSVRLRRDAGASMARLCGLAAALLPTTLALLSLLFLHAPLAVAIPITLMVAVTSAYNGIVTNAKGIMRFAVISSTERKTQADAADKAAENSYFGWLFKHVSHSNVAWLFSSAISFAYSLCILISAYYLLQLPFFTFVTANPVWYTLILANIGLCAAYLGFAFLQNNLLVWTESHQALKDLFKLSDFIPVSATFLVCVTLYMTLPLAGLSSSATFIFSLLIAAAVWIGAITYIAPEEIDDKKANNEATKSVILFTLLFSILFAVTAVTFNGIFIGGVLATLGAPTMVTWIVGSLFAILPGIGSAYLHFNGLMRTAKYHLNDKIYDYTLQSKARVFANRLTGYEPIQEPEKKTFARLGYHLNRYTDTFTIVFSAFGIGTMNLKNSLVIATLLATSWMFAPSSIVMLFTLCTIGGLASFAISHTLFVRHTTDPWAASRDLQLAITEFLAISQHFGEEERKVFLEKFDKTDPESRMLSNLADMLFTNVEPKIDDDANKADPALLHNALIAVMLEHQKLDTSFLTNAINTLRFMCLLPISGCAALSHTLVEVVLYRDEVSSSVRNAFLESSTATVDTRLEDVLVVAKDITSRFFPTAATSERENIEQPGV